MAKHIVKLEKEDIKTTRMGLNFIIQADGLDIVFSKEALIEFVNDCREFVDDLLNKGEVKQYPETHKSNWRDKLPFKDLSKEPEDKA